MKSKNKIKSLWCECQRCYEKFLKINYILSEAGIEQKIEFDPSGRSYLPIIISSPQCSIQSGSANICLLLYFTNKHVFRLKFSSKIRRTEASSVKFRNSIFQAFANYCTAQAKSKLKRALLYNTTLATKPKYAKLSKPLPRVTIATTRVFRGII